jgi:hypothetical protein
MLCDALVRTKDGAAFDLLVSLIDDDNVAVTPSPRFDARRLVERSLGLPPRSRRFVPSESGKLRRHAPVVSRSPRSGRQERHVTFSVAD